MDIPKEDTHRERCVGRGAGLHALARHIVLPAFPPCSPTQKLSEPPTVGDFTEPSSHRHDGSLAPSPASLPFPENGGWG